MSVVRKDLWASTSNKELNFLQHVANIVSDRGRAAIIIPDGVLTGGGAGEVIRRKLLDLYDVHTLLRLPTGIFYAQGVNANVLFFERRRGRRVGGSLWVYDLRARKHFTLAGRPLVRGDLDEFVRVYNPSNRFKRKPTWSEKRPDGRWRSFGHEEVLARDEANLDIHWINESTDAELGSMAALDLLIQEILTDLKTAMAQISEIAGATEVK